MSYSNFLIEGRNRSLLLEKFRKNNIAIYKIKIINQRKIIITTASKDSEKVFAICGNMWYNKKIKSFGLSERLKSLVVRPVLAIGIAFFLIFASILNNYVLNISVLGVSEKGEILRLCNENGAKRFVRFSSFDTADIKKSILISNENYSFVTVKKMGSRLIVDIQCTEKKPQELISYNQIVSKNSGTITSLSVYRGTAIKSVGDTVYSGDVIVDGNCVVGDETYNLGAIASFTIRCVFEFEYYAKSPLEKDNAIAVAIFNCPVEESLIKTIDIAEIENELGIVYNISIGYDITENGG